MNVSAITYRLAPENVFPLPLHDVLHGYLRLLAPPLSIAPENIIIAGDSAGGGLSLALCMYLRDEGYKMPAGLVLMSPWVDLTMSCGSWDDNADSDVVPRPDADGKQRRRCQLLVLMCRSPQSRRLLSRSRGHINIPHSSLRLTTLWRLSRSSTYAHPIWRL